MQNKTDLHIHSTASDGTDTPEEIVRKAKNAGVRLMSLTDHDTIDNLEETAYEARNAGIRFVGGVELSVIYRNGHHPGFPQLGEQFEMHLLGYGFDPHNENLLRELDENRRYRLQRIPGIIKKLNDMLLLQGKPLIDDTDVEHLKQTPDIAIGRPHLAGMLVKKGLAKHKQDAFDRYLIRCDVPKRELSLENGSALIRQAGGRVVMAHPGGHKLYSLTRLSPDIETHAGIMASMSEHLDGIECYYWEHTLPQARFYARIAKGLGLIVTAGSDHHGGRKDRIGRIMSPEYVTRCFGRSF